MKKVFYLLVFLVGTLGNLSAQMVLFKGTFEEAEEKAKEEKKDLFVDFYADWCGPCKAMASEVFTRPEVGEYFNAHFICLQVNVEAKENANLAKTYRVIALPTMVFIRSGKELRRIEGVKAPEAFIKEAKIALGEELSFDQLYDKFKKDKKNFELQQQLLLDAPVFMSSLQGYDREKWASRIESLFPDYLKNKKLENMVNEWREMSAQMKPSERQQFDDTLLCSVAERGTEVMRCATMLFLGMVDDATTFAETHGGGGGGNDLKWGRDEDEDNRAWALRCMKMASRMMRPSSGKKAKR